MSQSVDELSDRVIEGVRPEQWATLPIVTIALFALGLAATYAHGGLGSFSSAAVVAAMLSIAGTAIYLRELILRAPRPARIVARSEPGRHRR